MIDKKQFLDNRKLNVAKMAKDEELNELGKKFNVLSSNYSYVFNWDWLGLPIIQFPADITATQEIIWKTKPTVIIECGVARGGSIIFNASQLALLDICDKNQKIERRAIGIDIEIREENRDAIENHPLSSYIKLIEASSNDKEVIQKLESFIKPEDKVMVILDSNHTHEHVLDELNNYAGFVSSGCYLIVHDTGIEYAPEELFQNRHWGVGNNPLTAVNEFLFSNSNFEVDKDVSDKLLITSSPNGYLIKK